MNLKEYIDENFDIEGMRDMGFFTTEKTYEEYAERICTFFGFKTIYEYDLIEIKWKEGNYPGSTAVKADRNIFSDN